MKSSFLKIFIFTILGFGIANAYTSPTDAYRATIEYSTKVNSSKYSYESKEEGLNEVYAKLYPQLEGSAGYARTDYTRNDMAGLVMDIKEESYNEAIEKLRLIVEAIEKGDLEVDLLSEKVKEASRLIKLCKDKLYKADLEVKKVLEELE
jgi:exodeoxyribonuclease VII small subunit